MQAIPEILVGLIALILVVVAIGLLYFAKGALYIIAKALEGVVKWIPIVGGKAAQAIANSADPLIKWLGSQATGFEAAGSRFFQGMWKLNVQMADSVAGIAADTYAAILRLQKWEHKLIVGAPSKPAQKAAGNVIRAGRDSRSERRRFEHGISTRVSGLERELGTVRRHGVPVRPGVTQHGLETRLNTVEHQIVEQRNLVRNMFRNISKTDAITVFGVATTALSLQWLRCNNWRNLGKHGGLGRLGCRLPKALLGLLLGAGIEALLITDICKFAQLALKGAKFVLPAVGHAFVVSAGALCDGKHSAAGPLTLLDYAAPPVPSAITLG